MYLSILKSILSNNFRLKAKTQEELLCHVDRAIAKFNQLEESVIGNYFQRWRRNLNFALNNRWDEINNWKNNF